MRAEVATGERYTVPILRQVEQGTGEAQHAARDLIDDLAPKLVLVVGIAGVPHEPPSRNITSRGPAPSAYSGVPGAARTNNLSSSVASGKSCSQPTGRVATRTCVPCNTAGTVVGSCP
jgi:hypothetical protein